MLTISLLLTTFVLGNSTCYSVGETERVPASEIIHLYKKEFPQQVRGIPPFNAILNDLKQLDDYKTAEIMAAKVSACLGIFYEHNNDNIQGNLLGDDEEENGEFIQSLEPGMASVAPKGYNVKSVAPTHPNGGYGDFNKSILKQVASSLGVSYAKLCKDYEAVNYSSLREGTLDEAAFYAEMQNYLVDNWKEAEFKLFIENLLFNSDITLKAKDAYSLLRYHTWITQKRGYFDPAKELVATERELKMGLKSPIMIMEESGLDPDEVMKSWALYKEMEKKYNLNFNVEQKDEVALNQDDVDLDNTSNQTDYINTERN